MGNALPISEIAKRLNNFATDIGICFTSLDWEKLAVVLIARQSYLEYVLDSPVAEENRDALIKLVEGILAQDADSLSKIAGHQKKVLELRLLLDKGLRAIKVYNT